MEERIDDHASSRPAGATGDALHRLPHALVRYGGFLLLGAVALLVGVAATIEFPETLEAEFSLVGTEPPVAVVAAVAGRLELDVEDGERVEAGGVLGSVGGEGKAKSVAALARAVADLEIAAGAITELDVSIEDAPESVRPELVRFLRSVRLYEEHLDSGARAARRAALRRQVAHHEDLAARQETVNVLLEEQVELAADLLSRYGRAKQRGLVTVELEVERAQGLARARQALEEGLSQLQRHRHEARGAESRIEELDQAWTQEAADRLDEVRSAHAALVEGLTAWERSVLLRAPVAGQAALFDYRTDGRRVAAGDTVLIVVPTVDSPWAYALVSAASVALVEVGQPVRLEFRAFPSSRYGYVGARVTAISAAGKGDDYAVRVEPLDGLRTTSGHPIPSRQGIVGTAEIVTRNRTLLSRILGL